MRSEFKHRGSNARAARIGAVLAVVTSGCAFSNTQPEVLVDPDDVTDTGAPSDAGGPTEAGRVERAGAGSTAPAPAAGSGSPSDAGAAGAAGGTMNASDAGAGSLDAGDAEVDAGLQPADDLTCAFELAGCLLFDPLNYAKCARMHPCSFLAGLGAPVPAADGGMPVSAACGLQVADCIMRAPERAQECVAMLDSCTL